MSTPRAVPAARILVLYWYPEGADMRLAVRQHLHVLDARGAKVLYHNAIDAAPRCLGWTAPDLCVLHTTFLGLRWNDDFESYRRWFRWVSALGCPKVALPQDEYDHSLILEEWLLELGATSVHSCFGPDQRSTLYPALEARVPFHKALTGYIDGQAADEIAARFVPRSERPLDIVYRAAQLPYWFGSHGQLKHRLAEAVRPRAAELGFSTDISTRSEDTILGDEWLDFLMSGRATIGCESGSSALDPRGELQRRIRQLLAEKPDVTFEEVDARMLPGWDSHAFFAISPRHLEAVVTKTAQVLVEGGYSGVLEPDRHYIPVRRDLANLDEALERLRDVAAVDAMTERAYRDVFLNGRNTLEAFAEQLLTDAEGPGTRRIHVPFAVASRLPRRRIRMLAPRVLTLVEALVCYPELRWLSLGAARGAPPLRDLARDLVRLRVLARIRRDGGTGREPWSLSVENPSGTVVIRTQRRLPDGQGLGLDGAFERVVWDHSAVASAAPLFPRQPQRGWIGLGGEGRHEFRVLAEVARRDPGAARAVLERTLAP